MARKTQYNFYVTRWRSNNNIKGAPYQPKLSGALVVTMNRYEYAFRIFIFSFSLIFVTLLVLNFLPENSVQEIEASIAANLFFASIASAFSLSGTYLWLTGFSRFKATIGCYGFKWLIYVSFNMLAAVYLHWKYKRTTTNKVV